MQKRSVYKFFEFGLKSGQIFNSIVDIVLWISKQSYKLNLYKYIKHLKHSWKYKNTMEKEESIFSGAEAVTLERTREIRPFES